MMQPQKKNHSTVRRFLRSLKWVIPLALITFLLVLAFQPKPVEVDVGEVDAGAMMLTVDDDGETRVRERYLISAPLAGRLLRIGLEPGDAVCEGDVLATIDPGSPDLLDPRARAQAEAMVKAAGAAVERAHTQLRARKVDQEQMEKAFRRNQGLHEKGNVSDAAFEDSERAYLAATHSTAAAESEVAIAEFELEQAKAALLHSSGNGHEATDQNGDHQHAVIHSPINGTVLRVLQESAQRLAAGTPLLEVGDPSDLELRIDVLSQDAISIEPGQNVIIDHWGGSTPLRGRIRLVEPSAYTKVSALGVDEQRVNVIADLEALPDDVTVGDGYRIEARIVVWESSDALKVPAGAMFRRGEGWAVYRVEENQAHLTEIEVSHNNGDVAEVLSGLSKGDVVILHPGDRVENGTRIRPRS